VWIFLPFGFFSIVRIRRRSSDDELCVRARRLRDLVRFREALDGSAQILRTPERDYPFRLFAPRVDVARAVGNFVLAELNYPNFKAAARSYRADATGRLDDGEARTMNALHDVWSAMQRVEDPDARCLAPPKLPKLPRKVLARRAKTKR
jgi:hypothetical protein